MKKGLYLILLILLGELCWAQSETLSEKPKGRVVMTWTKTFDEIWQFGEVQDLREKNEETVLYFNEKGNICHKRYINGKTRTETVYNYNKEDKITQETTMTPRMTDSAVVYDTINLRLYTYDQSGRVQTIKEWEKTELKYYNRYEYTSTGYKMYRYGGDGSLIAMHEKKGQEETVISEKEGMHIVNQYDNANHLIKTTWLIGASNGVANLSSYATYNKYGDPVCISTYVGSILQKPEKSIVYDPLPSGEILAILQDQYSQDHHVDETTYTYEYDTHGNWVVQCNNKKKIRYIRKIIYAKNSNMFNAVNYNIERSRRELDDILYQEILRRKKEKAEKEAQKIHEQQMLVDDSTKKLVLTESRNQKYQLAKQKELMSAYRTTYPYIYSTVQHCKEILSISSIPNSEYIDLALFHPIDMYMKRVTDYIELQQTVIKALSNNNLKKENKKLEHALKKANNLHQRIDILSAWLKEREYDLAQKQTKQDSQTMSLYQDYSSFNKKIETLSHDNNRQTEKIIQCATNYISFRLGGYFINEHNLVNISTPQLSKCIEIQNFIIKLLTDSSLNEDKETLYRTLERIENEYKNSEQRNTISYLLFEEYLNRHGIIINHNN